MQYNFPFPQNSNVIELGGGTKPYFRPNLDVRAAENVDIVADFNKPLPIEDNQYDGIFSSFCIEHISWRKVFSFLKECYRIVKPGNKVVFLTANTEEQIKHVQNHDEWEDECSKIIFGDQDYDENTHRNSLCPKYAIKLCVDAGFENVIIFPFGDLKTDMIIEATKPNNIISKESLFDKKYFNGSGIITSYKDILYRDFPYNWIIYDKLMAIKPESVLELGCSRGYILHRLKSDKIPCHGIDISKHAYLTRVVDDITTQDLCQTPWSFEDKQFDVCFSHAVLQFIPSQNLPDVINEINRVSKRGLHGINLDASDNYTIKKPQEWWQEKFGANQQIKDKNDMEQGSLSMSIPQGDGKIKLNVGSYTVMLHNGWINMDIINLGEYAAQNQYKFIQYNATKKMPFDDNTVDYIVTSHMLEHLSKDESIFFLQECARVLKIDGVVRIIVPDAEKLINLYQQNKLGMFDEINDGCEQASFESAKLWSLLFEGHKIAYDFNGIKNIGESIGFKVEKKSFTQGNEQITRETKDYLPDLSLYAELTKI